MASRPISINNPAVSPTKAVETKKPLACYSLSSSTTPRSLSGQEKCVQASASLGLALKDSSRSCSRSITPEVLSGGAHPSEGGILSPIRKTNAGEGERGEGNNRDEASERSFLYNNYTKNNRFCASQQDRFLSLQGNAREFCYGPPVIKKHFPAATKEWNNSVYAYNSKRTILLSAIDKIVKKLIKSYFNSYFLSSPKIRELSVLNKVYVSKPEIKHTNSKVIITIYKYGSSIKNKNNQIKINDWQNQHINNTLSKNLLSGSPLNHLNHSGASASLKSVLLETDTTSSILPSGIPPSLRRQKLPFGSDEKDTNLYYFSDLISKFYGSRVELRIIDLKYLHLNTSILVEYLSNKLTNRKKILRKYRFLLRKIKLPVYSKHKHNNLINNNTLKELSLLNNISNLSVENLKKNKLVNEHLLTNMALSSIKYKAVVGARFEIGGRLTRRNIASKSVFKFGQVGTLKNIDASYKGLPVVTLRGNHRPNLDFSSFNTRTRNGTYNVKG